MDMHQDSADNTSADSKNVTNAARTQISSRKLAANQRNAKRSTGSRTDAGKAQSARNSYKHGFFARRLFGGTGPETAEGQETTELGEQIWDYYAPVGYMEELLLQKIVCESVRYGRLLVYEQEEFARRHAFFNPAVDRVLRYQGAINRQLFQAVKQLEDMQNKRKARSGGPNPDNSCAGSETSETTVTGDGDGTRPREGEGGSED